MELEKKNHSKWGNPDQKRNSMYSLLNCKIKDNCVAIHRPEKLGNKKEFMGDTPISLRKGNRRDFVNDWGHVEMRTWTIILWGSEDYQKLRKFCGQEKTWCKRISQESTRLTSSKTRSNSKWSLNWPSPVTRFGPNPNVITEALSSRWWKQKQTHTANIGWSLGNPTEE